jgi:hypothetical protein
MRTTTSIVTFLRPFILNRDVGVLPAGTYEIETDEEEIVTPDRTAYRRTAICFYVESAGSTRTLAIDPADLDTALRRDADTAGSAGSETLR